MSQSKNEQEQQTLVLAPKQDLVDIRMAHGRRASPRRPAARHSSVRSEAPHVQTWSSAAGGAPSPLSGQPRPRWRSRLPLRRDWFVRGQRFRSAAAHLHPGHRHLCLDAGLLRFHWFKVKQRLFSYSVVQSLSFSPWEEIPDNIAYLLHPCTVTHFTAFWH